jgi:hypothetical protein
VRKFESNTLSGRARRPDLGRDIVNPYRLGRPLMDLESKRRHSLKRLYLRVTWPLLEVGGSVR